MLGSGLRTIGSALALNAALALSALRAVAVELPSEVFAAPEPPRAVYDLPEPLSAVPIEDNDPVPFNQFEAYENLEPQGWARLDYLNWSITAAPTPTPLVTQSPASSGGILGQPGTQVLRGNQGVDLGRFSGGRLTIGGWFDDEQTVGGQFSFAYFAQNNPLFSVGNNGQGSTVLAVPFVATSGQPSALVIAQPGVSSGAVTISNRALFYSVDGDLAWGPRALQRTRGRMDLLAGIQWLELDESMQLATTSYTSGATLTTNDRFRTDNSFLGGTIGSRLSGRRRRWTWSAVGKVGFGADMSRLTIGAQPDVTLYTHWARPNPNSNLGFFARSSNIGLYSLTAFSMVPQTQIKCGYSLAPGLTLNAGYDALFWTAMMRPGNAIDPTPGNYHTTRSNVLFSGSSAGLELVF